MASTEEEKVLARKGWVSLAMAAKIIGISYPTAQAWKKADKISVIRIGGVNRVTRAEISRILSGGTPPVGDDTEEYEHE